MTHTKASLSPSRYFFESVTHCEMCGDSVEGHIVLGQRLNQSQGLSPKRKTGISVSVMKCRNCALIYAQPMPVPFDIQDHYGTPPEEYWKETYFVWTPSYFKSQIEEVKRLLPFREGMTALDVGAGLGKGMISLDKAGFDTYGFEPSMPFYERAISKMGIDPDRLKLGMIEELTYPDAHFDFITFGAVVEHLYHPAESIAKALQWLKPNGIIHIEVPSSKHLIARFINFYYKLKGTNFVTHLSPMHAPFHLYEFSLDSFTKLGARLGFRVEHHQFEVCEISHVPSALHPLFRTYMKRTDTGMQLTVYLRKLKGGE